MMLSSYRASVCPYYFSVIDVVSFNRHLLMFMFDEWRFCRFLLFTLYKKETMAGLVSTESKERGIIRS